MTKRGVKPIHEKAMPPGVSVRLPPEARHELAEIAYLKRQSSAALIRAVVLRAIADNDFPETA